MAEITENCIRLQKSFRNFYQMTNSTTDDAILDADGSNHGADNMEGSFVIYPYQ